MANLLDWNTLDHKVKSYIDADRGIDKLQKAFPVLMVATLLDVSDEEAADAIQVMRNTAYPGERVSTGGGVSLWHLASSELWIAFVLRTRRIGVFGRIWFRRLNPL